MPNQNFKIARAPKTKKLSAEDLRKLLWKYRTDTEWNVLELKEIDMKKIDVDNQQPMKNTDKEVWSRNVQEEPFLKSSSISISKDNTSMTLCLGGYCCTMSIEQWHKMATEICNDNY